MTHNSARTKSVTERLRKIELKYIILHILRFRNFIIIISGVKRPLLDIGLRQVHQTDRSSAICVYRVPGALTRSSLHHYAHLHCLAVHGRAAVVSGTYEPMSTRFLGLFVDIFVFSCF